MPLTEKGREIKSAMEHEYGQKKGENVFYASTNKGNITGVHGKDTGDVPEVGYRSSIPSGASVQQLNESNRQFWAGNAGVGQSPNASDQGNNWTPGERKVAVGNQAMLTPAIQASRQNAPGENLFEKSAGTQAGDEHVGFHNMVKKMEGEGHSAEGAKKIAAHIGFEKYGKSGMEEKARHGDVVGGDSEVSAMPQINKSNFNPGAGLTGRGRDDKEDQLFGKSAMGTGQDPHSYLEPKAMPYPKEVGHTSFKPPEKSMDQGQNTYVPARGVPPKPTEGPSIKTAVSVSGTRPVPMDVKEYKPVGNQSLTDVNARNKAYWEKNAPFNVGGKDK